MDTAVVVIRKSAVDALRGYLSARLPQQSEPWVMVVDESRFYFNICSAEDADLEEGELPELRTRLGTEDLSALLIDVGVRNVGCEQLRAFVAAVAERFSGLASDDLHEHWWTASEIRNSNLVAGRVFWPHDVELKPEGNQ
jgi:hypothetical protein